MRSKKMKTTHATIILKSLELEDCFHLPKSFLKKRYY